MARLLVGQIANSATPNTAAAKLYILGTSYGQSVGTDVPLLVETEDVAPAGPTGTVLFRRIEQPVTYDAACRLQVTPVVDFMQTVTATGKTYTSPTIRTIDLLDGFLAQVGTTIRVRTEVVTRNGPIEIAAPLVAGQIKTGVASAPVGTEG